MRTDELIHSLAARAGTPIGPKMSWTLVLCLAGAAVYSVAAVAFVAGVRPDFSTVTDWVLLKAGLSVAFALVAAPLALRVARPGKRGGALAAVLALLFCGAFAACIATALGAAPGGRWDAVSGGGFPHILIVVPLLAAPVAALLFGWMHRQAPTRPAVAGGCAGVLAGAVAAAAYSLTCPVDAAAFVAGAYSLAIAICGVGGLIAGRFLLRW